MSQAIPMFLMSKMVHLVKVLTRQMICASLIWLSILATVFMLLNVHGCHSLTAQARMKILGKIAIIHPHTQVEYPQMVPVAAMSKDDKKGGKKATPRDGRAKPTSAPADVLVPQPSGPCPLLPAVLVKKLNPLVFTPIKVRHLDACLCNCVYLQYCLKQA